MLVLNPKVYVVAGAVAILAGFTGLAVNQYLLAATLHQQELFDSSVVKENRMLIEKAVITPLPTATPSAAIKEVRPTVTIKPNLTHR